MRHQYHLGFISDEAFFDCVGDFVTEYGDNALMHVRRLYEMVLEAAPGWSKKDDNIYHAERRIYARIADTSQISDKEMIPLLFELIEDRSAVFYWVDSMLTESTLEQYKMHKDEVSRLYLVSMDKFYEIATGDSTAYANLSRAIPLAMADVNEQIIQ